MSMAQITNWDEVDSTLKRLAELVVAETKINGDATIRINEIKKEAADKAAPLQVERAALEKQIELFCEANKAEFADKRSKELNFGTVGYRVSTSVAIPRDKKKVEALIKSIKAFGLKNCIAYEEKPDKEALKELDDTTLTKLGLKRKIEDNFRIEPRIEEVADTSEARA
ncbi:MAG: host-nuclease inhibitor Gam family protein [Campylobacteraceae bacterium]|nr:host-nuclease inhibitor Gam family protein [Campylobacteraceae bacterium]